MVHNVLCSYDYKISVIKKDGLCVSYSVVFFSMQARCAGCKVTVVKDGHLDLSAITKRRKRSDGRLFRRRRLADNLQADDYYPDYIFDYGLSKE